MDILRYKEYEGSAELDMTRGVCRGKILFIHDLVTYESTSPTDLQKAFEDAVDDYISTCATLKRTPQKPLKGQFSVRIPPSLHKAAVMRSLADGVSLNDVVVRAVEAFVNVRVDVNHTVQVTLVAAESVQTVVSSAAEKPQWKTQYAH